MKRPTARDFSTVWWRGSAGMARKPVATKDELGNMTRIFILVGRTWVSAAMLLCCGWLAGCGGPATQPGAQFAQLQAAERKNPMQEQLMAQMGRATLTGYKDYVVGPEDLLTISFFGFSDLDNEVRVNGQGEISLALVGTVKVGGMSPQAIEDKLSKLYREGDYVKAPQISVIVKQYRHQRVMVTGAVRTPGAYEMIGPRTLLEMLGQAGGFTEQAGDTMHLIRAQSASEVRKTLKGKEIGSLSPGSETIVVDVKRLVSQGNQELNLPVKNGDVIFVPFAQSAYVLGAVTIPKNVPVKDNLTATQAVAMAGGQHLQLSSNQATVVRLNDQGRTDTFTLNLKRVTAGQEPDITLKGGDIVFVQESTIRRAMYDFKNLFPGSYSFGSAAAF
jgi:polysaccharide biosynthesis/export protein